MKVVPPKRMNYLEMEALQDGASENDFMEEAGSGVALVVQEFIERYGLSRQVAILGGKGNNAGDAYIAGINLLHLEYTVAAFQIHPLHDCSEMTQKNAARFAEAGGKIYETTQAEELILPEQGVILDGLFGTGFARELEEPYISIIHAVNESGLLIISIDIPSGLNGETGMADPIAIKATETAYLGLPKSGFFLNEGWDHVGMLKYVDFGLPPEYIEEVEADLILLSPDILVPMLPKIKRTRHKYEAGLVIGLAGSPGMPGAALMASLAALRGGAGIVKLVHPIAMQQELGTIPFELVKIGYEKSEDLDIVELLNLSSACFIGPGIGLEKETRIVLRDILLKLNKPAVIDADALRIIGEDNLFIPPNCILTPHRGEMAMLLGTKPPAKNSIEFLRLCQAWVEEKQVTLVLKGAPTFIFHPHEPIHVSGTGDPGMATAGCGDILTGLIAALLAQRCTPHEAARLGVYIHGLAGEHAAQEKTSFCLIASDLLDQFPAAFAFEAS